jgi:prepilin-type N-terminal cleavage/methylation domain-containing protein
MVHGKTRGFTLLEILAVLAILGIVLGLTFPGLAAVRRSSLRNLTTWRFREMVEALEEYRLCHGHYPSFLQKTEVPISLADPGMRQEFVAALAGTAGASNPSADDRRFFTFHGRDFDGMGRLVDAFGNGNIFLLRRGPGKSAIPRETFPENIREWVPDRGVDEELVLWSVDDKRSPAAVSWR